MANNTVRINNLETRLETVLEQLERNQANHDDLAASVRRMEELLQRQVRNDNPPPPPPPGGAGLFARPDQNTHPLPRLEFPYFSGTMKVEPQAILARRFVKENNQAVTQVLVHWSHQSEADASWEDWTSFKAQFPNYQS
ncbi:hypothetical protein LINPERHAP2_LOCUS31283 [Linum perenne]